MTNIYNKDIIVLHNRTKGHKMIEVLFGSKNAERVLQFLNIRNSGYGREIADFYNISPSVIKKQLDKFEASNIIVGKDFANARIYELIKRCYFYNELRSLLIRSFTLYSDEEKIKLVNKGRTRPRSNNKPLIMRDSNG